MVKQATQFPLLTIISMADHREVPQYMDIPWFITCVIALTISARTKQKTISNQTVDGTTMKYAS